MTQQTGERVTGLLEARRVLCAPGQPFAMDTEEIGGVRTRVWQHAPVHLRAVLQAAVVHGPRDFIRFGDEVLSYDECFAAAGAIASRLRRDYGVGPGDRVAIAMRNYPEWVIAFWAVIWADAVLVPLNSWWSGAELAFGLRDSGARVVFADGERVAKLRGILGRDEVTMVAARPDEVLDAGVVPFRSIMAPGAHPPDLYAPFPDQDSVAAIMYTSGTTGRPKGAVISHRNVCSNFTTMHYLSAAVAYMRDGSLPGDPSGAAEPAAAGAPSLSPTPLFHVSSCFSGLLATAASGGTVILMYRWDAAEAVAIIERDRVAGFGGVPAMIWQLLDEMDGPDDPRLASLQSLGYGSAPAPPELLRRVGELLPGRHAFIGYGLTETTSITSSNRGADYLRKPASVGPAVPVVDVEVVDPDGRPVPRGSVGELLVRGPNVIRGYWNAPAETAAAFVDGWLHTGDLARLDDEGFIYIVDRAKDMILRGGENVYCAEVESVLMEHPAVEDVALIGVPHQVLGEEVGAVIALRSLGAVDGPALTAWLDGRIAGFKIPAHFWFQTEELPRNPSGKVLKRELRSALASNPIP
jgi:long-chain acyl-CoA synthetase